MKDTTSTTSIILDANDPHTFWQWGHDGQHAHGGPDPHRHGAIEEYEGDPRRRHHHHDERCERPPSVLLVARVMTSTPLFQVHIYRPQVYGQQRV